MEFRVFSIIAFAVVLGCLLLHGLIFSCGYECRFWLGSLVRHIMNLFVQLFQPQKPVLVGRLPKLAFLLGLLSFCVLLLTGFGPLLFGCRLQGYLVMIHVTFAPVFIVCTAFIAIAGAATYAFNRKDADAIQHRFCSRKEGCWVTDSGVGAKAGFWVLVAMSLPVTLTILLCMLPLFGPEGQEFMFHAHRWCSLFFALTAIVELYMLMRIGVLKNTKTLH